MGPKGPCIMGGLMVSTPNGMGRGRGKGKSPWPGGERTAAASMSLISLRANSRSAMVELVAWWAEIRMTRRAVSAGSILWRRIVTIEIDKKVAG